MVQRPGGSPSKKKRVSKTKKVSPGVSSVKKTKKVTKKVTKRSITKKSAVVAKKKVSIQPKIQQKKQLSSSAQRQLLILSPLRFPISVDTLAIQTARFAGVAFVFVGALLTLFYSNLTFSAFPTGQSVMSAVTVGANTTSLNCETGSCTAQVDTTPDARLSVSGSSVLKGTIETKVEVPAALEVSLSAFFKTKNTEVSLGKMNKVSDEKWLYSWDTTRFDDGEYKLKIYVRNAYTSYEQLDSQYRTVGNHQPSDVVSTILETTANSTSDATGVTDAVIDVFEEDTSVEKTIQGEVVAEPEKEISDINVSIHSDQISPIKKSTLLTVNVTTAEKVKIYATQEGGAEVLLGYAYKHDDSHWRYKWNSALVKNGIYKIRAQVLYKGAQYLSKPLEVTVYNEETQATTDDTTDAISTTDDVTNPKIAVILPTKNQVQGKIDVRVAVENANYAEVYSVSKRSATRKYLGQARKIDTGIWGYVWDTTQTPNAETKIAVKIQTKYGIFEGFSDDVLVSNPVIVTTDPARIEAVSKLTTIKNDIQPVEKKKADLLETQSPADVIVTKDEVEEATEEVVNITKYDVVFETFRAKLDGELQLLATALRSKDNLAVERVKSRIQALKREVLNAVLSSEEKVYLTERIDKHLQETIARVESDVIKTDKLIAERTNKEASTDSDNDGITDYDEVTLYKTDPFVADSDNDGFIDGAEILNGYDPTNSAPEVAVVFESPKEVGVVREDILAVESVTTAALDEFENKRPKAVITGRALPNSFVTLYIFSTPVVVTVKTDEDGSWNYRFDKELEDGEHEVYVGVTDNAGKIIAKSNPFVFIKEAEAFSPVETTVGGVTIVEESDTSLISTYMIYMVLSISVVAIGLVLILLGLHLDTRPRIVIKKSPEEVAV